MVSLLGKRNGWHVLSACAFALSLLVLHSITSQYAWIHIAATLGWVVSNMGWNWKDVCSFCWPPLRAENSFQAIQIVDDALSTQEMVALIIKELRLSKINLRTEFINIERFCEYCAFASNQ
jgi:hypothetical protein